MINEYVCVKLGAIKLLVAISIAQSLPLEPFQIWGTIQFFPRQEIPKTYAYANEAKTKIQSLNDVPTDRNVTESNEKRFALFRSSYRPILMQITVELSGVPDELSAPDEHYCSTTVLRKNCVALPGTVPGNPTQFYLKTLVEQQCSSGAESSSGTPDRRRQLRLRRKPTYSASYSNYVPVNYDVFKHQYWDVITVI